jgi:hypothetical protein
MHQIALLVGLAEAVQHRHCWRPSRYLASRSLISGWFAAARLTTRRQAVIVTVVDVKAGAALAGRRKGVVGSAGVVAGQAAGGIGTPGQLRPRRGPLKALDNLSDNVQTN